MSEQKSPVPLNGLLYAALAFGWWGCVPPLYFNALRDAGVLEILAHRIVWSVLFLGGLLLLQGLLPELWACLRDRKLLAKLGLTTVLIAINWLVYIYGVDSRQVVQTSLGYFINPLLNVLLGLVFFAERLRGLQWLAVGLAAVGVAALTVAAGEVPWIALALAGSFGVYGLLRKTIAAHGVVCLAVEVLLLAPVSLGYLVVLGAGGAGRFGVGDLGTDALLVLSAVITTLPLLWFGQAARRLPLTILGFVQYLAPTLQFLTATLILGEPMDPVKLGCFGFIWAGLVLYSLDSLLQFQRHRTLSAGPPLTVPAVRQEPVPEPAG